MEPGTTALIEALLFVSDRPLSLKEIAELVGVTELEAACALQDLEEEFTRERHGIAVVRLAGGYTFRTKGDCGEKLLNTPGIVREARGLSRAALETLTIIAYKQPVTRMEIEALRGVKCDGPIETLLERGLIREAGRKALPGKPIVYATTPLFLELLGLNSLSELPAIGDTWDHTPDVD